MKLPPLSIPSGGLKRTLLSLALALGVAACAGTGVDTVDPKDALTTADRVIQENTLRQALETSPTGQGLNWQNPETGHRGTVTPVRTYKSQDGEDCRIYQQTITVQNTTELDLGGACRRADGVWRATAGTRRTVDNYAIAHGYRGRDYYYYPYNYPYDPFWYPRYGYRHPYYGYGGLYSGSPYFGLGIGW